jgi:hypothetical protein
MAKMKKPAPTKVESLRHKGVASNAGEVNPLA